MTTKVLDHIDANNANFHDQLQEEIEYDMARMKTSVAIIKGLRCK